MAKKMTFKERVIAEANAQIEQIDQNIKSLRDKEKDIHVQIEGQLIARNALEAHAASVEEMPMQQANGDAE